jgi:hypothetical protein
MNSTISCNASRIEISHGMFSLGCSCLIFLDLLLNKLLEFLGLFYAATGLFAGGDVAVKIITTGVFHSSSALGVDVASLRTFSNHI